MENFKQTSPTPEVVTIPPAPGSEGAPGGSKDYDSEPRPFEVPIPPEVPEDQRTRLTTGHYADFANEIDKRAR